MTYRLIVIGVSLGGLQALPIILAGLPAAFPLPVAVVQHRRENGDEMLVSLLQSSCKLAIKETEDKDELASGTVYLAPAGYHLLVEAGSLSLSMEGTVNSARPSIDVLFKSAADAYGNGVIGIVLTGANTDGAQGLAYIKERGGMTVVQDPLTATCETMPRAAIAASKVDEILSLEEIAGWLCSWAAC